MGSNSVPGTFCWISGLHVRVLLGKFWGPDWPRARAPSLPPFAEGALATPSTGTPLIQRFEARACGALGQLSQRQLGSENSRDEARTCEGNSMTVSATLEVAAAHAASIDSDLSATHERVAERRRWIRSMRDEIHTLTAQLDAGTHRLLTLLREFDEGNGWEGYSTCAGWLSFECGVAQVTGREWVRVARALGGLPEVSEQMRVGRLSYSKVRALTRVATPKNEKHLVHTALYTTAAQLERACQLVRQHSQGGAAADATAVAASDGATAVAASDGAEAGRSGGNAAEWDGRFVRSTVTESGRVRFEIEVDPEEAEIIQLALRLGRRRLRASAEAVRAGAAGNAERSAEGPGAAAGTAEGAAVSSIARGYGGACGEGAADVTTAARCKAGDIDCDDDGSGSSLVRTGCDRDPELAEAAQASAPRSDAKPVTDPGAESVEAVTSVSAEAVPRRDPREDAASREERSSSRPTWSTTPSKASPNARTTGSHDPSLTDASLPDPSLRVSSSTSTDNRAPTIAPHPSSPDSHMTDCDTPHPGLAKPSRVRSVDALLFLMECVLARGESDLDGRVGAERQQLFVHLSQDRERWHGELHNGTPVSDGALERLACDCGLTTVIEGETGAILDVGRRTRSIPSGIRRALEARDRGCRFPGCDRTHYTEGHHIKHWVSGGETKLTNLVLLCHEHHRLVHEGAMFTEIEAGEVIFRDRDRLRIEITPCAPIDEGHEALIESNRAHGVEIDLRKMTYWSGDRVDWSMQLMGVFN